MEKIKIRDINNKKGSEPIRKFLIHTLTQEQLLARTNEELCFYALQYFNLKRKIKLNDTDKIKDACQKILEKCGAYVEEIYAIRIAGKEDENRIDNPCAFFVYKILGFKKLPYTFYSILKNQVEEDLKKITDITSFYEKDEFIKRFIEKGEQPRNHYHRTLRDFYIRCINERKTLLEYYINGLAVRAIEKADYYKLDLGIAFQIVGEYRDRPYRIRLPFSEKYFDYRKIDTCSHRVGEVRITKARELIKLYHKDANKFYKEVNKILPATEIFKQIDTYYIHIIPGINSRQSIFNELKYTFRHKKWHSFSALALTQIEGLFSEMLKIIFHDKDPSGSLSDKVNAVRPSFHLHESHFDYFQYHLPNLRNRFLHFGNVNDTDVKNIAYDLLHDLHYILKVFTQIKTPLVELQEIVKRHRTDFINKLSDFNYLFSLIEEVKKKKQFGQIETAWKNYEENVLAKTGLVEYYSLDLTAKVAAEISSLTTLVHAASLTTISLDTIEGKSLQSKADFIIEKIKSSIQIEEPFVNLGEITRFFHLSKIYLINYPIDVMNRFNNIQKSNAQFFKKISFLYSRYQKKERELSY